MVESSHFEYASETTLNRSCVIYDCVFEPRGVRATRSHGWSWVLCNPGWSPLAVEQLRDILEGEAYTQHWYVLVLV